MEANFWHEKWELGQLGFHEKQANPLLVNHLDKLTLTQGDRIFLPLCGKTLDIGYLINLGYQTVGIELSEIAVQDLFKALNTKPVITHKNNLKCYQADNIDVYVGDFFELDTDMLGKVDAIYDRAALIALPHTMRARYTQHLTEISSATQQLLITLEYDQTVISGPPFSLPLDEIQRHYDDIYAIKLLESNTIEGGLKGKVAATENAWVLNPLT